jgi:uncharacterized protein (DUF924 family)
MARVRPVASARWRRDVTEAGRRDATFDPQRHVRRVDLTLLLRTRTPRQVIQVVEGVIADLVTVFDQPPQRSHVSSPRQIASDHEQRQR